MNDILEILAKIFGLDPNDTLGSLKERGKKIHSRFLMRTILLIIPLILAEYALNLVGLKGINLIIGLIISLLVIFVASREGIVLSVLGLEAFSRLFKKTPDKTGDESIEIEVELEKKKAVKDFLDKYIDTVGTVLLWASIASLFLGTLPFGTDRRAIILMLSSLLIIKLAAWKWEKGFTLYKDVIYYYAIGCFLYSVYLIIPPGLIPGTGKTGFANGLFSSLNLKSRELNQSQRTRQIPAGETVYSCTTSGCIPLTLKYTKSTEVVAMDESVEVNGVIFEKFSLPDPVTDQPGKYVGFIPVGKFSEKLPEKNPGSDPKKGNQKKEPISLVLDKRETEKGTVYGKIIPLEAARYTSSHRICAFLDAEVKKQIATNDFGFVLKSDQEEVEIISLCQKIILTPQ
ncbi:MAG: hypothetical protein WCV59_01255 [Parcubacteria group bacterium]|jgi:hypothetical protein